MKRWKKLSAFLLAAVLALGVLTACGQQMVRTEDFVHMVQRNLQRANASSTDGRSGLNLKVKAGEDYRKEADALLNKYVEAYEAWRAKDPVLEKDKPDLWKIWNELDWNAPGYVIRTYASKGKSDLNAIQRDLNDVAYGMADDLWWYAYRNDDTAEKTITVAEKEVNGWYYLVAVSKVNAPEAQPW